jgi:putative SbcD/Mre11-related phosphoesterase
MLTLLTPQPAALIRLAKTKTLVIADPHIGWEMALQAKGIHVPSQTPKLLKKLTWLLSKHKPDSLLILGDVKYTVVAAEPGEWHDIPDFFTETHRHVTDISVVRGNHDANLEPLLPEEVKILPATGARIGEIGLFHGHKWPSLTLLKCKTLIMGHVHPVVVFRDPAGFKITRQIWIKAKINTNQLSKTLLQKNRVKIQGTPEDTLQKHFNFKPQATQVFIMPSFNDFLGGRAVNEVTPRQDGQSQMIGPLLRSDIVDLESAEIYLLDGTYLGTLHQLRNMRFAKQTAQNL